MSRVLSKIFSNPFLLILATLAIKIPMFFTKHIQEDSFITWRVARNLLNYGVIGFNGDEKISASTTHLYVLVSVIFQFIFGENFIYPILIFSCILFAVGTILLGKVLFPYDVLKRGFFVIFLNMIPPSLTASCLGMEYGILFFLYGGLMYYGIFRGKKWAYFVFPFLLLWTRIDTVIFLGVFFLVDLVIKKKINFIYILCGILGLSSVVLFNYLYFGELVNHTITAKKIAYKNLIQNDSIEFFLYQWAYYGGLVKKYGLFTFLLFLAFLGFLAFCIFRIIREKAKTSFETKVILIFILVFALLKITVFAYFRAYFDWYYWLPRVFLFAVVLYYFLNVAKLRKTILLMAVFIMFSGLYFFQILQSYTIGYMEERQRMQISDDLKKENAGMEKSILLEPAGIIPFFTNLYTYDEVGLVNKRINDEMEKDENFWWINSVKDFRPDYILTINKKPDSEKGFYKMKPGDKIFFDQEYTLVKHYPIDKVHKNAPKILKWIYGIRPIGKDYFLYEKANDTQ